MALVTASIVNWNTRDSLRRCLEALRRAREVHDLEIIVADNASADGSAAMVAREFPEARLLTLPRNGGFAAGNNAAIEIATGEYILILNPDVEIDGPAVSALVAYLENTPEAAAVSPLLVGRDGVRHTHLYRRFPSFAQVVLFWTVLGPFCRRIAWLRRRYFEHDLDARAPIAVDQLPGAAMLVRRRAFDEIGMLDPDYFIWFEDVDWCYRARSAGHGLHVLPWIRALHTGGESFRSWSPGTRVHQFYRAFARFLCKHRLEGLRRWGVPLLLADLVLKEAALRSAQILGWDRLSGGPSLRAARAGVRQVIRHHRRGELVRFVNAGIDGVHAPGIAMDHAPSATAGAVGHGAPRSRPAAGARPMGSAIDAVIVNWNGLRYLPACLQALREATVPVRIIVVDNASTDGSVAYLRTEAPEIELIEQSANTGYAAGANAGLARGDSEYAIVLNPDVILAPDHLARLRDRLDADPRIGAAQGKLYRVAPEAFAAGELQPAGPLDSAGHIIRRSRMVVDRGQGRPDGPEFDDEVSVFSACGAALFLRRAMLEDLAPDCRYFDESFFAYKEEIDLCWRARLLGWDIRYVPRAVGFHVRAWAGDGVPPKDRIPPAARRHSWKNHYLLMLKNDRIPDTLRALPAILAWEAGRQGYALLRDPGLYRAYADLIRLLPSALRQRRQLMRRRRALPGEVRRWFGRDPEALEPASGVFETRASLGSDLEARTGPRIHRPQREHG